jgi:hypothetical protein
MKNDRIKSVHIETRVGIHRASVEDFISDLQNCCSQSHLYIGFIHKYGVWKSIYFIFGWKLGCFYSLFEC